mmetsp:Transcript_12507/g.9093  ORF Transcript_12507/g.9093 Transcript_12507/m.9093 type:complete len:117 (+) Transcript_12507:51-401(+)
MNTSPWMDNIFILPSNQALANISPTQQQPSSFQSLKTKDFAYSCMWCGSKFSQKTSLRHHMRVHTGEKPFACRFCGWKFATKGNMIDHERRHLKEKPYRCTLCSKRFYRSHQLKNH